MELRALKAFVKVVELGNISHAAIALGLTQSSLSRTVAGLEKCLGTTLFYRTGRGVQITETGEAIVARARSIVVTAEQISAEVRDFGKAPSGVVTIALPPSVMREVAADLYHEVRERQPGIRLRMLEGFSNQIEEWLNDGRADVAMLSRYRKTDAAREPVLVESHLVFVGVAPVNKRKTIRFREAARLPLVLPASPNALRIALEDTARRLRVKLNVIAEADSLEAQRAILEREGCYTVVSRETAVKAVAQGQMHSRKLVEPHMPRLLVMATTSQRPLSRAGREVAAIARRLVAR